MFIRMSRSWGRFGRIEIVSLEERLTAETRRAQSRRREGGPRLGAVFAYSFDRKMPVVTPALLKQNAPDFPGAFLFELSSFERLRAYFFAAPKFFVISSQFTTFHQASIYSGRRF
jgi:hypothetical protein